MGQVPFQEKIISRLFFHGTDSRILDFNLQCRSLSLRTTFFIFFKKAKHFFKQSYFFPRANISLSFIFFSPAMNALMFRTQKVPPKSATIDFKNIFLLPRGIQMCKLVSRGRKQSLMSHPIRSRVYAKNYKNERYRNEVLDI